RHTRCYRDWSSDVCSSDLLEFAHAAKAFGVRPITGAEVTLQGGSHVTLLVESPRGYANLCLLLTAAHAGTRPNPEREPAAEPPRSEERRVGKDCGGGGRRA